MSRTLIDQSTSYYRHSTSKQKWLDPKRTKNRVRTCQQHPFCAIQYQWNDESFKLKKMNCPLCASIPNVILPDSKQRGKPITYNRMTEQSLDDWIAQSINRNLKSMLNPQKKYKLADVLEEDLKVRYKAMKNKSFGMESLEQQLYFPPPIKKKAQSHLLSKTRKKQIDLLQLKVDQSRLTPNCDTKGIPIRIREEKKFEKKPQPRRRGGVYLERDYYYRKFKKQVLEPQQPKVEQNKVNMTFVFEGKNSIYSYNMENIFRKSIIDPVKSSIIEDQLQRMKDIGKTKSISENQLVGKFARIQQESKNKINQKAHEANKMIMLINNHEAPRTKPHQALIESDPRKYSNKKQSARQIPKTTSVKREELRIRQKVINLLNDIKLISEVLDPELLSFNIHSHQIITEKYENKPHIKWILKAQEKIREKRYQLAIDCYKQSLIIYPESFIAVYNIASLMEKVNSLSEAKKWFELSGEFNQQRQKVTFGLSIVCFKKSEFKQSLQYIDSIIKDLEQGDQNMHIYYYVRSLNYKKLGMVEQAKSDYRIIQPRTVPENYNVLANLMFSLVFAKMRRLEVKFNCLTYMRFRQTLDYILQQNCKLVIEDKTVFEQDPDSLALKLSKLMFFKRFPVSIIKKLLHSVKYHKISKGRIMFPGKQQTFVILSGLVVLKNHQRNFLRPDYIGLYSQGDVLGAGELENYFSQKPNLWYNTESEVEYISMHQEDFSSFWKAQFTLDLDEKYVFLKNVKLLKNLSQICLLRLCEMFEKRSYKKGNILFNDCSYRNKEVTVLGRGFGLGKKSVEENASIKYKKISDIVNTYKAKRGHTKLYQIIMKHRRKLNTMKFRLLKYPGLYILIRGQVEIQDDNGFRTTSFIKPGDFFGQNLIFESEGYQKFGRIIVESSEAEFYFLGLKSIDKLITYEKEQMKKSTSSRKDIETLKYLYKRFHQVQKVKIQSREEIKKLKQ